MLLDKSGVKYTMKKKETEFLTEDEAQAILRVPDRRTLQGKRDYAILLLLLSTGLRKAEICSLKVGDLKTYRSQPVVDVLGKGRKFRRIPLKAGEGEPLGLVRKICRAVV
jgi:integrase